MFNLKNKVMVLKTKYKDVIITCLNFKHTNSTLISSEFNGEYVSFIYNKKRIAEQIVTNEVTKELTYNRLKKEYKRMCSY